MPLDAWPSLFLLPLELPGISLANLEFFFHATDGASDWGCVIVARKTKQRHLGLGNQPGTVFDFHRSSRHLSVIQLAPGNSARSPSVSKSRAF